MLACRGIECCYSVLGESVHFNKNGHQVDNMSSTCARNGQMGLGLVAQADLFSLASLHTGTFKVPMNEALQQINLQTLCEQTLEYNSAFH